MSVPVLPWMGNFVDVAGAPRKFQIGQAHHGYIYEKMGDDNVRPMVWKCCKAADNYANTDGKVLYLFPQGRDNTAELFLAAHGDEHMTTPEQVRDAYLGRGMTVVFGSMEPVMTAASHCWYIYDGEATMPWDEDNTLTCDTTIIQ